MKKFFILVIFLLVFWPLISAAEKINDLDVEWESSADYTLSWTNPTIARGDYVIKVIDFNWKGDAVVAVTRNGETQHGVLSQGETRTFNFTKNTTYFEGVQIHPKTVSNFLPLPTNIGTYPCCPAAEITVTVSKAITQKKPVLELKIEPNWNGRTGVSSAVRIEISNTGDANFAEGNLSINISGLIIAYPEELSKYALTYNPSKSLVTRGFSTFFANATYQIDLSLKSPIPSPKSSYKISAKSYFKDFNGKIYSADDSETVTLNPTLELTKRITAYSILGDRTYGTQEIDVGFLPKVFGIGKVTVVNINVTNMQIYPVKSVNLTDAIMENFRLIDYNLPPTEGYRLIENNTKLQWVFDLNASETKLFRYELTAEKIGTFSSPAAIARWTEWGLSKKASSEQSSTRVYGIYVVVSKRPDRTSLKPGDGLNVTVTMENIGDFPVGINVTDILPKNTTFISGTTAFSGFLYPKESGFIRYNLSSEAPGELELTAPHVVFWKKDYEGSYGFLPAPNVSVLEPSVALPLEITDIGQNITPVPTETPIPKGLIDLVVEKAPWLEGAIPIIMLLIAIVLMLMLHVINR